MPRVIDTAYRCYINSAAWRKKRQERLEHDGWQCARCDSKERLEVHHLTYDRLGWERLEDLLTLCDACHAREHGRDPKLPPVGGPSQRELSDRGEAKYWLERWQEVVEKATLVDIALRDLRVVVGSGSRDVFEEIDLLLNVAMRDSAGRHGQRWDRDPTTIVEAS